MLHTKWLAAMSMALLLTLSGCGDDTGNGNSNSAGGLQLDELCDVMVDDLCLALMQCYEWDYRDLDHCRADQECLGLETLRADLEAGYLSYDAEAAQTCHQRLVDDPCEFGFFWFVPNVYGVLLQCDDVLTGHQAPGDPCVSSADCLPDGDCLPFGDCPGTCMAWAHEDEACDWDLGPECDYREDLQCDGGICVRPPGLGESCAHIGECTLDLWCNLDVELCEPRAVVGEACHNIDGPLCELDMWCDSRFDAGICQAPSGTGESCLNATDCVEDPVCHLDPMDLTAPGVCGPLAGDGDACDSTWDCLEHLACANDVCGPPPGLGEACPDDRCAAELLCEESVCLEARYPGEPCDDGDGVCVNSRCLATTCEPRAPLGATCEASDDCTSRSCEDNLCVDPVGCTP